jgi:hypothetical protein
LIIPTKYDKIIIALARASFRTRSGPEGSSLKIFRLCARAFFLSKIQSIRNFEQVIANENT